MTIQEMQEHAEDGGRFSDGSGIDPEYFEAIPEDDYCHQCGQIGCRGDA